MSDSEFTVIQSDWIIAIAAYPLWGLLVSCERTVRSGRGLAKFAGMIPSKWRVAALHCSNADRPPQISGRAQDTNRGGARESLLDRTTKNLACL